MSFKYLGCYITIERNLNNEVKEQTIKDLNNIWKSSRYGLMTIESKMKIYKRPAITLLLTFGCIW